MSTEPNNLAKIRVIDRRNKEKFFVDDVFIDKMARELGPFGTSVYFSLCRHSNINQQCFPSIKYISEELSISESSVKRSLAVLEELKIIALLT